MLIVAIVGVGLAGLTHLSELWAKVLFPASLSALWTILLASIVRAFRPGRLSADRDDESS
jgi:hypothetical protein